MNLSTVKWAQSDKNPIQRTVRSVHMCVCIALCTIVVHNNAQNRPDSVPPYPPDNHHCSNDVYLREGGVLIHQINPEGRNFTQRSYSQCVICTLTDTIFVLLNVIKYHQLPLLIRV